MLKRYGEGKCKKPGKNLIAQYSEDWRYIFQQKVKAGEANGNCQITKQINTERITAELADYCSSTPLKRDS